MTDKFYANTHQVKNVPPPLENYNTFAADIALQEALAREGGDWARNDVHAFGTLCGSSQHIALGMQASLLLQHAPNSVANAFCASRLANASWNYGGMPKGMDCGAIIERSRSHI